MSNLFKISLLLTTLFGVNKLVALLRQIIIAKQFGFSPEIDAFNVANNLPDLIVALLAGGALAFAFVPVLTETLQKDGNIETWKLFSRIANLVFLITAILTVLIYVFAPNLVSSQFGIAPGFNLLQQQLVVTLMRINLIATLIFTISGMIMAALHAHKHFLLPGISPIVYNIGQIFGALILAPTQPIHIGMIVLPTFGMGVQGLVYGTLIGAVLHLLIQVPALFWFKFRWIPSINLKDTGVRKVFNLLGPRIVTMLLIQSIFVARDNLASRLQQGSVTALTYGYFIMQVPETLIGSAIGTALLPTLSELSSTNQKDKYEKVLNNIVRIIVATTLIIVVLLSLSIAPLITIFFKFSPQQTTLLGWTTIAYLFGLTSQCLLEVVARAFYANQDAKTPLVATTFRSFLFLALAVFFLPMLGAIGLALADSVAVTLELSILLLMIFKKVPGIFSITDTLTRSVVGCLVSGVLFMFILHFAIYIPLPKILTLLISLMVGGSLYLLFIKRELKLLLKI